MTLPEIRLFNTVEQQKVSLKPISPGKIGIYVCGPTVYSYVHIGNARTFTAFDVVVRYLRARGFDVKYVRNYTDVDDKIINAAKEAQRDPIELAAHFVREFEDDAKALHLLKPDVSPKVSETIPEIVALVEKLISRGFAYAVNGDVYFEVSKYAPYGRLSKKKVDELEAGHREMKHQTEEVKRSSVDFALWKAAKPGEPSWPSPWGAGRPGWHIECSAMSAKYLGDTFDIHGGGLDLIFPHHENEIAQSEAASGQTLCNCWMHSNFLDLENAKMSKSLGNVVRLRDALKQVDAEALRYFFLSTHYRQQLAFSDKMLADAESRMEYFYETLKKVDERITGKEFAAGPLHGNPEKLLLEIHESMADDFNFTGALGSLSGLFAQMNELCDRPPVKDKALIGRTLVALRKIVTESSTILGLFEDVPAEWLLRRRDRQVAHKQIDVSKVAAIIEERQQARTAKNFAESDRLRAELKTMGIELMDTPAGPTWKVISDLSAAQVS